MKKQLLNILSEDLNKFVSILSKKIVVLKAAFHSNPISHLKDFQRRDFWGNLQIFRMALLLSPFKILTDFLNDRILAN